MEARDEGPVSDTAIPSMTRSSAADRSTSTLLGVERPRGSCQPRRIGDALTEVPGGTPTAKAQEVEVVLDLFQQPRPSTLDRPAAATVTKVNTE